MPQLIPITSKDDIPKKHQNTPIGEFLEYQNLGKSLNENYDLAQILVGMCMDNRKQLRIPENFAYILRTGGANLKNSEFKISYAIAVGGIKYIALIGHDNCGMCGISSQKEEFIKGLVDRAGWNEKKAEEHFEQNIPIFEIYNEIEFTLTQVQDLRKQYPGIIIEPMMYQISENMLYLIEET